MILAQVDDLQDLCSIIRASACVYGAFQGSKQRFLSAVVRNIIDPRVLPDALLAVRTRQLVSTLEDWKGGQLSLLPSNSLRNAIGLRELTMTPVEARQVCHLWDSHDYFIRKCFTHFLLNAPPQDKPEDDKPEDDKPDDSTPRASSYLSLTELARLQRAVLRYTTFQCIINGLSRQYDLGKSSRRVTSYFADYTPWEIEEVACFHQYVCGRLSDLFKEIEDHFVKSIRSTEKDTTSQYLPCSNEGHLGLDSQDAEEPVVDSKESVDWMFVGCEKQYQWQVVHHLASLGLPFLQSLFEANLERQKQMVVENYEYQPKSFVRALRFWTPPLIGIFETEWEGWSSGEILSFEGDDLQKRNHAWLWAHQNRPERLSYCVRDFDLREWGYVFWDSDRLQRWKVMDEPRPVLNPDQSSVVSGSRGR
jgi:hypothetical protein